MLDFAVFSHEGGLSNSTDILLHAQQTEDTLCACLYDGKEAPLPQIRMENLLNQLLSGMSPRAVLDKEQGQKDTDAHIFPSCCAISINNGVLDWANVGDVRLYHFSGGILLNNSTDDSDAYQAFVAEELPYAEIRMDARRNRFPSVDKAGNLPHTGSVMLRPGDALLLCSDGFWQYVFETEMEVDLIKATSAQDWLSAMLLRLCQRSYLEGDSFSALCCKL